MPEDPRNSKSSIPGAEASWTIELLMREP